MTITSLDGEQVASVVGTPDFGNGAVHGHFVMGGLMFYAAIHPKVRTAIIGAALIEKAALVMMIAMHWNRPFAKGFAVTALFDGACCVIFALYLAGAA